MRIFEINYRSRLVMYFYLITDKLRFSNNNAFILMFHHVTNDQVDASLECKCDVVHFTKVLEYLKNNRIRVVSMNEAIDNIAKGVLSGYAVITFDDGIDDTFTIAYPLLKTYNFPFTIYITLDYLGNKGYLTHEQLEILSKESLCTLGTHSLTHSVLRTAKNAREEIVRSKLLLEKIINKEVLHFAYPYGGPSAVSISNIFDTKAARYRSAVSTVESRLNFLSTLTKFYLPRINGSFFQPSKDL